MQIYVDESGDLGWSFDQPYGNGGSSRYLTIAALLVPDELDHLPRRKVKDLYRYGKWDIKREKKWVEMSNDARLTFAKNAVALSDKHPEICYKAIIVSLCLQFADMLAGVVGSCYEFRKSEPYAALGRHIQ